MLLTFGAPPAAPFEASPSDVLSAMPGNVPFALAVRNPSEFESRVSALSEHLGIPVRPFTLAKGWLRIVEGLDEQRSAGVALLPGASESHAGSPLLLLPTTDFEALTRYLRPRPAAQGLTELSLRSRSAFAAQRGPYTLIGSNPEAVQAATTAMISLGERLSPGSRRLWNQSDLFVCVDVASCLRPTAGRAETGQPWGSELLLRLAERVERLHAGFSVVADGLQATLLLSPRGPRNRTNEASESREVLDDRLLATVTNLPSALEFVGDAECAAAFLDGWQYVLPVLERMAGGLRAGESEKLAEMIRDAAAGLSSFALALSLEENDGSNGLVVAKLVRFDQNADHLQQYVENVSGFLSREPFVDSQWNVAAKRVSFRPAAESIAGLTVDQLVLDLTAFHDERADMLKRLLATDRLVVRLATAEMGEARYSVATLGGTSGSFERLVNQLRGTSTEARPTSEPWVPSAANPQRPLARGSFTLAELTRLAAVWSGPVGEADRPSPTQTDPARATFVVYESPDATVRAELTVPQETLKELQRFLLNRLAKGTSRDGPDSSPPPDFPQTLEKR